jgi:hypothetical protein
MSLTVVGKGKKTWAPLVGRTFKEIMDAPLVSPPWIVKPLIAEADRTVTYASWRSFKSLYQTHTAIALSVGMTHLGPFTIPIGRRVAYLDAEMSQWMQDLRVKRLAMGMGLESQELPLVTLSRPGVRLDAEGVDRIGDFLTKQGFTPGDVLFFDSMRRGLVGTENEQEAVSRMWHDTLPLTDAGWNLMLTHHSPKPKSKSQDPDLLASGNTDILAGADSAFYMKRNGDTVWISQRKNRAAKEWNDMKPYAVSFHFDGDPETGPIRVEYSGKAVEAPGHEQSPGEIILAYVGLHPGSQTGKILGDTGLSSSTFQWWKGKLLEAGKIESKDGGWYAL